MSKVAEEDERETCTFLPARGRFLLCNRGTQLGTMCWPRASSEPDSTTKTRECPPCMREKKRGGIREMKRDFVFLRCLTSLRFYGMHRMMQPARFTNLQSRFMLEERLGCEISLKDRLNEITRLAFALLENIGGEKSANQFIAMSLT